MIRFGICTGEAGPVGQRGANPNHKASPAMLVPSRIQRCQIPAMTRYPQCQITAMKGDV